MTTLSRWIKIVSWNLGLILAVALCAELFFGSWFQAPGLWNLGVFRDVQWKIDVSANYARPAPITYSRDYYGLRGSFGKPEAANIVALGGSTTDERKVDDAETWPEVLAACLRERGIGAQIANAAVAGQTTRGHARNFDVWLNHIPNFKPKLAIAYFGVNENALDTRGENDDPTRYFETKQALPAWHNLRNWIGMNSAILRLHRIVKGNIKAYKAGLHPLATPSGEAGKTAAQQLDEKLTQARSAAVPLASLELAGKRQEILAAMAPELEALDQRLAVLKAKIEAFGARPVFVTQNAASYRLGQNVIWGDVETYIRLQALAARTMAFCERNGVACVDLAAAQFFADGDAYDSVHTTQQGSAKIGRALCRQFDPAWLRPL
jgi:hypothetical protein